MATDETWIATKKLSQWIASSGPASRLSARKRPASGRQRNHSARASAAMAVRQNTSASADIDRPLANRPALPNRNTAT